MSDAADDVAAHNHLNLFRDKLLIISQDELIACTQFVHCQLLQTVQGVKCMLLHLTELNAT